MTGRVLDAVASVEPLAAQRAPAWPRVAPWLAGVAWVVAITVNLAAMGIAVRAGDTPIAPSSTMALLHGAGLLAVVSYMTVAVVLAVHRPYNAVGWIFAGIGLVAAVAELAFAIMLDALVAVPRDVTRAAIAAWASPVMSTLWTVLAFGLCLVFPDGRPLSRRWGALVWPMLAGAVALTVGLAFTPGPVLSRQPFQNPFGLVGSAATAAELLRNGGFVVAYGLTVVAAGSLVVRYRRGDPAERQALKWFGVGTALFLIVGVLYNPTTTLQATNQRIADLAWFAFCLAAALIPAGAAIGILRYGLFDIDRIISRAFVYGALTAILAGLYTASVRFFNWALAEVTGTESEIALVLTTLLLATTFTPIKKRLEGLVEHHWKEPVPEVPGAVADADSGALPQTRAELEALVARMVDERTRTRTE